MRQEHQIKVEGTLDLSILLGLGAEALGQTSQEDIYLAGEETWRIRVEAGQMVFATKSHDTGDRARVKEVSERIISKTESDQLIRERGVRVVVCKTRTLFRLRETVIALDEVEHLGQFVEVRSTSEDELFRALEILGLENAEVIKKSYLDMIVDKALPKWLSAILRFHDRVGELTFGITSGILTTVGVLVGVNSATGSKLSVVAAIAAIAVADSCSDAFGMYMSKVSERGASRQAALRFTMGTLAGKFTLPLTFVVPIFALPLSTAVVVNLGWASIALALLSAEQAIVAQKPVLKEAGKNLLLAAVIVVLSTITGTLVAKW